MPLVDDCTVGPSGRNEPLMNGRPTNPRYRTAEVHAPRNPGRTQKTDKSKYSKPSQKVEKTFVINDQTIVLPNQDDENVNAPQHGSDDEGTTSDGGSRSVDAEKKDAGLDASLPDPLGSM